jgi:hypothetical protein
LSFCSDPPHYSEVEVKFSSQFFQLSRQYLVDGEFEELLNRPGTKLDTFHLEHDDDDDDDGFGDENDMLIDEPTPDLDNVVSAMEVELYYAIVLTSDVSDSNLEVAFSQFLAYDEEELRDAIADGAERSLLNASVEHFGNLVTFGQLKEFSKDQHIPRNSDVISKLMFLGVCTPIVPVLSTCKLPLLRSLYIKAVSASPGWYNIVQLRCITQFLEKNSVKRFGLAVDMLYHYGEESVDLLKDMISASHDLSEFYLELVNNDEVDVSGEDHIEELEKEILDSVCDLLVYKSPSLESFTVVDDLGMWAETQLVSELKVFEKSLKVLELKGVNFNLSDLEQFCSTCALKTLMLHEYSCPPSRNANSSVYNIMSNLSSSAQRLCFVSQCFDVISFPSTLENLSNLDISVKKCNVASALGLLALHNKIRNSLRILTVTINQSDEIRDNFNPWKAQWNIFEPESLRGLSHLEELSIVPEPFDDDDPEYIAAADCQFEEHSSLFSEIKKAIPSLQVLTLYCGSCETVHEVFW